MQVIEEFLMDFIYISLFNVFTLRKDHLHSGH